MKVNDACSPTLPIMMCRGNQHSASSFTWWHAVQALLQHWQHFFLLMVWMNEISKPAIYMVCYSWMERPAISTDLQLISSNGVSLMNPFWFDWQAACGGTQPRLQTRDNLPLWKKWQLLHSYGKSHTASLVTWSSWALIQRGREVQATLSESHQ